MKQRKNRSLILSVLASLSLPCFSTFAAPYDDFKFGTPDRIDIKLDASYSKTEGNFEKAGNTFTKLPSGSSFQTYDFDFGIRAELARNFHMYGATRLTAAESQGTAFGTPQTKTNTGFASATVGTDFVLVSGRILVIPDFSFTAPLQNTTRSADSKVALSEGVMEGTGRVVARIERRGYRFGGFAGVTYRDGGRSTLLPYGALFELTLGKWNIGVDARGYQSLNYDKDADRETTLDTIYFCPVNGCSKRYGAFTPSQMESNLWVRINASRDFAFHLGGGMDWSGSNISRDATFFGGMIYRWDYSHLRSQSAPTAVQRLSPPSDGARFEEATEDGVDQRNFNPKNPKSLTPSVGPFAPARPKEKTINIQDELNKTEMQMEESSTKPNED